MFYIKKKKNIFKNNEINCNLNDFDYKNSVCNINSNEKINTKKSSLDCNSNELNERSKMLSSNQTDLPDMQKQQPYVSYKPYYQNQQQFDEQKAAKTCILYAQSPISNYQVKKPISPSLTHQYDIIDESASQIEIKKFLDANHHNSTSHHSNNTINNRKHSFNSSIKSNRKQDILVSNDIKLNTVLQRLPSVSSTADSVVTSKSINRTTKNEIVIEEYIKSLNAFSFYGKCIYGDVYRANSNLNNENSKILNKCSKTVIMKILRDSKHEHEFKRDIETYSKLDQENIVKFITLCTDTDGRPPNIIILEHTNYVCIHFLYLYDKILAFSICLAN